MYLGIDLGTSSVKAVVVDESQTVVAQAQAPLSVDRPRPLWSEQDPEAWWTATDSAIRTLGAQLPTGLAGVRGIGLSGQMHGAVLLDAKDRVLRPAILWNDGRSSEACRELERRFPAVHEVTGNLVMPGFTAPKLIWVESHEPDVFRSVASVLLPKDYLRLRLTGDRVSEMSDASGTLWLDVGHRQWSSDAVEATRLPRSAMPELVEGSEASGGLLPALAKRWGLSPGVPVAGGAGDQAAGAVGAGVIAPGQAFVALGTSGVFFAAGDVFAPNPAEAVHAFCHALPGRWHQMSVILSAASCLAWWTRTAGGPGEEALLSELSSAARADGPLFLPYLSGERTPHDDPHAKGVFFGLTHSHARADLTRAVLEGVAFALLDGQQALIRAGARFDRLAVIGGGAQSREWGRILASALGRGLDYAEEAEIGPAFGAARLARLAVEGGDPAELCKPPPIVDQLDPDPQLAARCQERYSTYRELYAALRGLFPAWDDAMVRAAPRGDQNG